MSFFDYEEKICIDHFRRTCPLEEDDCSKSHCPTDVPVCRFFRRGDCRHGRKCWLRHEKDGVEDDRPVFNQTAYRKALDLKYTKIMEKKHEMELLEYSANPYNQEIPADLKERDFDESLATVKKLSKDYRYKEFGGNLVKPTDAEKKAKQMKEETDFYDDKINIFFDGYSIHHWSSQQVLQFLDAACDGNYQMDLWSIVATALFKAHRPTPKMWAEVMAQIPHLEAKSEEHKEWLANDERDEVDELTTYESWLGQAIEKWAMWSEDVNGLYTGGVFVGLMALDPLKFTEDLMIEMIKRNWDSGRKAALVLVGLAKCMEYEAACAFINRYLIASQDKHDEDSDDDYPSFECMCTGFKCECPKEEGYISDYVMMEIEETGPMLATICLHMKWEKPDEKHKFFAQATKRLWPAPIMARVYHDYLDPNDKNPLGGCEPTLMSAGQRDQLLEQDLKQSINENVQLSSKGDMSMEVNSVETTDGKPKAQRKNKRVSFSEDSKDESQNGGKRSTSSESDAMRETVSPDSMSKSSKQRKSSSDATDTSGYSSDHNASKSPKVETIVIRQPSSQTAQATNSLPQLNAANSSAPARPLSLTVPAAVTDGSKKSKSTPTQTEVKLRRQENEFTQKQRRAAETNKCQSGRGRPCTNCPKKDCFQGMCRRCCSETGFVRCEAHSQARNILEAITMIADPSNMMDEWDDKNYSVNPRRHFKKKDEYEAFLQGDFPAVIKGITFGPDFAIKDEHVIKVAQTFHKHLEVLELGDSDTGNGTWVTSKAISVLTEMCPNLIKLKLESCTHLNDEDVIKIWHACPKLQHIEVSGHDKRDGNVSKKAVKSLFDDLYLCRNLRFICFNDQQIVNDITIDRLKRARPGLAVVAVSTGRDYTSFCPFDGGDFFDSDDYYNYY